MKRIIPVCPHCSGEVKELARGSTKDLRLIGHSYAYEELVKDISHRWDARMT